MEIKQGTFYVLPSPPDCCQVCGQQHPEADPHDPTTIKYQLLFTANHPQGRSPTWADAMAHCEEEIKTMWRDFLLEVGIDPDSPNLQGEINTEEELQKRLERVIKKRLEKILKRKKSE